MCSIFCLLCYQYLPSDWLERLLWGSLRWWGDCLHKAQAEECLWFSWFTVLFHCFMMCFCWLLVSGRIWYISYSYGMICVAWWPSGWDAELAVNRLRVRIPASPLSSATLGKLLTHVPRVFRGHHVPVGWCPVHPILGNHPALMPTPFDIEWPNLVWWIIWRACFRGSAMPLHIAHVHHTVCQW